MWKTKLKKMLITELSLQARTYRKKVRDNEDNKAGELSKNYWKSKVPTKSNRVKARSQKGK